MNATKNHSALLEEWAALPHHSSSAFVSDGIVDEARWDASPRKVLFLLKEAYGDSEPWDLREKLREEWGDKLGHSFWSCAYWAYLIHNASENLIPEIPDTAGAFEAAREALLSSAIVNIKKSGGESASQDLDLAASVERDGEFIRRQVDLIAPGVVICGNVWSLVKGLWPEATCDFDMVWSDPDRIYIDFWHPGSQYPGQIKYYSLAGLLHFGGVIRNSTYLNRLE